MPVSTGIFSDLLPDRYQQLILAAFGGNQQPLQNHYMA
jgi:hypothetical protein